MDSDDAARHYHIDASRMLDNVRSIPDQIEEVWESARDFTMPYLGDNAPFVISGLGGSAIGGRLLKDFLGRECSVPVRLERGYALDSYAGTDTSVVCVSYSGNTEEVLSVFEDARSRGCNLAVVTSGGKLGERAVNAGVPVCTVPGGLPPRAAIGYLFTPLLRLVSNLGIRRITDKEIASTVRTARRFSESFFLEGNQAENKALQLAKRLYGKIPLVYSGDGLLRGVAYRWKCQINENSKAMAFYNVFPELGHNEVMGWECPERLREDLFIVMLRDREDHPRIKKRMDITYAMLEPLASGAAIIESDGAAGRHGRLPRLFSVLLLGDFTSVYLAVEYGKDPTPIEKIEQIKELLGSEDT